MMLDGFRNLQFPGLDLGILTTFVVPCAVGCALSLISTPVVRRLSLSFGIVDAPDGFRKLHKRAVPLGGGIAVAFSCAMTIGILLIAQGGWAEKIAEIPALFLGVAAGAIVVCVTGLLDDRY